MKIKFRLYWIPLTLGLLLFALSLPPIFLMTVEYLYSSYVHCRYEIKQDYTQILVDEEPEDPYHPYETKPYIYGKNEIDVMIVPKKKLTPILFSGDVDIYLNGKFLGIVWNRVLLSKNPDTPEEPATFDPTSTSDVSVYVLRDRFTKQEDIIIFADITTYQIKAGNEYMNHRYYPQGIETMTRFQYWRIHQDGTYEKSNYRLNGSRSYLETFLARKSGAMVGHYTTLNYAYPVLYFPLLYPLLSAIVGIVLVIWGLKRKRISRIP
jgi:hypothetical protein